MNGIGCRRVELRREAPLLIMVGLGGALGAMARYGLGSLLAAALAWPWGTLVINAAGSLLIGLCMAIAAAQPMGPRLRLFLTTGFLGGYTTFSAFAHEVVGLGLGGRLPEALLYAAASLVGCVTAARLGFALWPAGRRQA